MNPRYPTTRQFRRHRNRKFGRPILVGLIGLIGLYWIFSGSSEKHPPAAKPIVEEKTVEAEVAEPIKNPSPPPTTMPTTIPPKSVAKSVESVPRRLAVINPATQDDSLPGLEPPEPRFGGDFSAPVAVPKDLPAMVPAKSWLALPVAPKTTESIKPVDDPKAVKQAAPPKAVKQADPPKAVKQAETAKSSPASKPTESAHTVTPPESKSTETAATEESQLPSAPKELAPKPRVPDLDMTFYRELPRRKVIVALEEPSDTQTVKPLAQANDKPAPAQEKTPPLRGSGSFVVQLAVFNDSQRAATMVGDLQKRGVPARVVKSKDGTFHRIRLGPFPSHADATKSLIQWKLSGYSTLIFQDNGG